MRIWAFAVRRWQFTLLLFGLLIAVGYSTLQNIPRSEDPEFHAPVPTVIVAYPGADPIDIERLIVDPIEDAISELDDIKRMDSRSLDGVGVIQIEFHWDQDADEKYDEVVREVNRIRSALPPDIASPRGAQGRLRARQHRAARAGESRCELSRAGGARRVAERRHRDGAGRAQQPYLGVPGTGSPYRGRPRAHGSLRA